MLATQLKYDLQMFFREIFYLFFIVVVPPVTYILMGQLYGGMLYANNLSYAQVYTPSFILLITFGVIFFSFGFEQVMNRVTGIEKRIHLSPVPMKVLLISSMLKAIILNSIGFILILVIGLTVYDLSLSFPLLFQSYLFFIVFNAYLLFCASTMYSFFNNVNSALVFSIVIFQIVMFTGSFAMPVQTMPDWIQMIAKANPVYHLNEIFINIWNGNLIFNKETMIKFSYLGGILVIVGFVRKIKK